MTVSHGPTWGGGKTDSLGCATSAGRTQSLPLPLPLAVERTAFAPASSSPGRSGSLPGPAVPPGYAPAAGRRHRARRRAFPASAARNPRLQPGDSHLSVERMFIRIGLARVANAGVGTSMEISLENDLIDIIKRYFDAEEIHYKDNGSASDFAALYFEMRARRIVPRPRAVHFSDEIHDSLGELTREKDAPKKEAALTAWRATFKIWYLLTNGQTVLPYLSKKIGNSASRDGLLWDYGMHHFHLNLQLDESGFVQRSSYLLLAIVTEEDAYFVDVRRHEDLRGSRWVRQDLLRIVASNWPNLMESRALGGVRGSSLTEDEERELRRKRINYARVYGEKAIAPLGGGMMGNGSSLMCRWWGMKLVHELKWHESYLQSNYREVKAAFHAKGIDAISEMRFQPVSLDSLELSPEAIESLQTDDYSSSDLYRMGFVIVESQTGLPIRLI